MPKTHCDPNIIALECNVFRMGDRFDFGKSMGDDMMDADLVSLDGMGMGGEMTDAGKDQRGAAMSETEAEMNVDFAMMDGIERDTGDDATDMSQDVTDAFGLDLDGEGY